jgi:hypothetical protein
VRVFDAGLYTAITMSAAAAALIRAAMMSHGLSRSDSEITA